MMAIAALLAPGLSGCGGQGGESVGEVIDEVRLVEVIDEVEVVEVVDRITFAFGTRARSNPTAEDLLDHWNDAERLRAALGLPEGQDIDGKRTAIGALLEGAGAGSGTRLRNVDARDIGIIGDRDGITYGQWKGGPAGTLNIEFDWRFAQNADTATRVWMERAGKSWSRRILDEFGTHRVPRGSLIRHGGIVKRLDEDVMTDDVLILVLDKEPDPDSISSAGFVEASYGPDDLEPWLGSILLSRSHHGNIPVMAHEIGHVLGIFPDAHIPSFARYANFADNTFEGPEAMRANGGAPVPFQWVNADGDPVAPDTPGAEVDYGHPGVCSSLMAYCSGEEGIAHPGRLDFAILADLGYEILDEATAAEPEIYGYGAWGRYSAWGVGVERLLWIDDTLRAAADAFGTAPATSLADSTILEGDVSWTGSLLGVDTAHVALPPVFGDAVLRMDLASLAGMAHFENLAVDVEGVSRSFRMSSLDYAIGIIGNGFSDEEGRVMGGFFGPGHEEMAGVLDDRYVGLLAGFGGTR